MSTTFCGVQAGLGLTGQYGESLGLPIEGCTRNSWKRIIGQRATDALAEKRAEGITLGRPTVLPQAVRERILAARSAGDGLSAIARALNADEVPTAHGGAKWHPSTVRAVVLGPGAQ
jgi:hypothetical protein